MLSECQLYDPETEYYVPLHTSITVKMSSIQGLGIFSKTFLEKGLELGISHVKNEKFQHGVVRTALGAFINHSESPNCVRIDKGEYFVLITTKDIEKDKELTLKYSLYNPNDFIKSNL